MVRVLMYIWNIHPFDQVFRYINNCSNYKDNRPFRGWRYKGIDTDNNDIRTDIVLQTNHGEVIVKVGDYVIINPDGTYFNDLQYLKNNV